jgi:hypothetical protein
MDRRSIADLRRDLANAQCELLSAREALRTRQPLIESEIIAQFCGGDPRRLGYSDDDRRRQLAVLSEANEELHGLWEAVRTRREAVIHRSAELQGLLDDRRELKQSACERLANAIMVLAASGAPTPTHESVVAEVRTRLS